MSLYLRALIYSAAMPLILSFYPPLNFYRKTKALFSTLGLIILIYGTWDVYATWRGHWSFNPIGVYTIRIFGLPIEEVLFFVVIPFCCIFTWEVLKYIRKSFK